MAEDTPKQRRSHVVTQGTSRAPNRAMLRAMGYTDEDFSKPIVGIANGYSTITPCNMGLNDLAKRAEAARAKPSAVHSPLAAGLIREFASA